MTAFLSRLLRFILLVWLLSAASPLTSLSWGYDAQPRPVNTGYDARSLSAIDYDSASTVLTNENERRSVETGGSIAHFGEFLAAKSAATVDQYALKAVEDGFYPVMKRGFAEPQDGVWLKAGDVWKYGTTKNPATRYSQSFLNEWGLRYEQQFSGTLQEALSAEKVNILNYLKQMEKLPPGNKFAK